MAIPGSVTQSRRYTIVKGLLTDTMTPVSRAGYVSL